MIHTNTDRTVQMVYTQKNVYSIISVNCLLDMMSLPYFEKIVGILSVACLAKREQIRLSLNVMFERPYVLVRSMFCVGQMQWYSRPSKSDASSTLSEAELRQLALGSNYYAPAQYPSSYRSTGDAASSSLVLNYSAVSDASALSSVASKLESQAASATYTTPLGIDNYQHRVGQKPAWFFSKVYNSCMWWHWQAFHR